MAGLNVFEKETVMRPNWRKPSVILGLACLLAGNFLVGCVVHDHGRYAEVDVVDDHGWHHQGYYDDYHDWHGGYYDDHHEYHDDGRDWRR
jgi:hypothetical protein